MNKLNLDLIIVIIFAVYGLVCYRKGLVRSVFDLFSTMTAIFAASKMYPYVTRFIRQTSVIYDAINNAVKNTLGFSGAAHQNTLKYQVDFINGLAVPDFLKSSLVSGNNSVIYQALNVSGIEDYIAGFVTNIIINILSWIIAFVIVLIFLKFAANTLDVIAKLPVLNTFNKVGGLFVGFLQATIFIWVVHLLIVLLLPVSEFLGLHNQIEACFIANIFAKTNMLLQIVNKFIL